MIAALSGQRQSLLALTCVAGIVACWLTATPLGLLAPIAALYAYVEGRTVSLLRALFVLASICAALAACLYAASHRDLPWFWGLVFSSWRFV